AHANGRKDGGDHAADSAGVGVAFAVRVHAAGAHLLQVVVAHDPGDRSEDKAEPRNQGADSQHEDDGSAVRGQVLAASSSAASRPRRVVIVVPVIVFVVVARAGRAAGD